jgi:hypothetical protein
MPLEFEVRNALEALQVRSMCNLHSITRNQAAIRDLFKVTKDTTGNLPPLPAIFPDQVAPVVRENEGERELKKFKEDRPFGTPEATERKLLELANAIEADHAGRVSVAVINKQFREAGGSYEEYGVAV